MTRTAIVMRAGGDAGRAVCLAANVAAAVCALIEQPRSSWTFELDLHTQPNRSA